ncbi:E3 ubiquitin-protein ligase PUB22-like [Oryza glaberrima]|uniref:E3 ubiquitin-protein ligase PUB22-like n=1 Tax=Oryza glaberrima TaxID=4538 RepID=UPI00224C1A85|nr:E3 ubiquitin-protein ligase PUB22-like [Oryza glaberrima]
MELMEDPVTVATGVTYDRRSIERWFFKYGKMTCSVLLLDANRHVAERSLLFLKRLCKCPDGRLAFAEHGLAVAAVARAVLRVSGLAMRLAVNVLWLVACAPAPAERVLPCWRTWRWAAPWRSCWR